MSSVTRFRHSLIGLLSIFVLNVAVRAEEVHNGDISARIAESAFYVSPSGDDNNDGRSAIKPFRTLEKAQTAMRAQGQSPDVTYLEGGIYTRTSPLELTGYPDQNKSWIAYPGETPILDGSSSTTIGIRIITSGVVIKGITIRNFSQSGIYAKYSDHLTIEGNQILNITTPDWRSNTLGSSIFLLRVRNSNIRRNYIDGNTATGIQINGGSGEDNNSDDIVSSNRIYNTCKSVKDCGAVYFRDLGHVSRGQQITHNWIGNFGTKTGEDVAIYLDDETSRVIVSDNIIYGVGTYGILIHGGDHNVVCRNVFDISHVTKLGLYQDDVGSGNTNYGMSGNRFERNIIYASSVLPYRLWDYINQSGGYIQLPGLSDNIYHAPDKVFSNGGVIVDAKPLNIDPLFVDPGTHDYRLRAGSPALRRGIGINPEYVTDPRKGCGNSRRL